MFLCDVKQLSEAMCGMLRRGGIALLHFELEIDCSLDVKSCMKPLRRKKKNILLSLNCFPFHSLREASLPHFTSEEKRT